MDGGILFNGGVKAFDVVVLGAGGAGLMCAVQAGKRGRRVAVLDHSAKVGGKILISGGGRCNFTNTGATPEQYVSANPHFARSAMSRYTPDDFIALVKEHGIAFNEKHKGQLFCDISAKLIVQMFVKECEKAGVNLFLGHDILSVRKVASGYVVETQQGPFAAASLVVATGGISIPKMGATGLGYDIARQFGLKIVQTDPALDGFVFGEKDKKEFGDMSGIAIPVVLTCGGVAFDEDLLFTHLGLSGPASLQGSLYWRAGQPVHIDLVPAVSREELLAGKKGLKAILTKYMPKRLADRILELHVPPGADLGNLSNKSLQALIEQVKDWTFVPKCTVGYSKAEVTRGGVDTAELSSKTMEAKKAPGLYFIGEVVDVTGWLGGYNFQWAWASGWAAGQVV